MPVVFTSKLAMSLDQQNGIACNRELTVWRTQLSPLLPLMQVQQKVAVRARAPVVGAAMGLAAPKGATAARLTTTGFTKQRHAVRLPFSLPGVPEPQHQILSRCPLGQRWTHQQKTRQPIRMELLWPAKIAGQQSHRCGGGTSRAIRFAMPVVSSYSGFLFHGIPLTQEKGYTTNFTVATALRL